MGTVTSPRVLFLFPHDFSEGRSGSQKYCAQLIEGIRKLGRKVHLVGFRNFESQWDDLRRILELVDEVTLYNFDEIGRFRNRVQHPRGRLQQTILRFVRPRETVVERLVRSELVPHLVSNRFLQFIDRLLAKEVYEYGFVTFAYWSEVSTLLRRHSVPSVMITQDVLARQPFAFSESANLDAALQDEFRRVRSFDFAISISHQEAQELRSVAGPCQVRFLPVTMKETSTERAPEPNNRRFDAVFGGHTNEHNQYGFRWFLTAVLPLLPKGFSIAVFGKICQVIASWGLPEGVVLLGEVDDLGHVYTQSRVAICPLQSGTGMKVKVVEALSYGLPVVTTSWGVIGFPASDNTGCTIADTPEAFAAEVRHLLNDPDLYAAKAMQSRTAFQSWFTEETTIRVLRELLPAR